MTTALRQRVVGIAAKPEDEKAQRLTVEVISWLSARSIDYRLDFSVAAVLDTVTFEQGNVVNRQDLALHCDPIIVLGGDGTLLSVSRHAFGHVPSVIGVNVGRLGFLAEIDVAELFDVLQATLDGKVSSQKRHLLEAKILRDGALFSIHHAMNDVVVTKEALARIFALEVSLDDKFATVVRGDGLIVGTPLGSTAYSMAAGGAIVHPGVDAMLITPICPHSLTSRPLIVPGTSHVALRLSSPCSQKTCGVILTIDGQEGIPLNGNDVVVVRCSDRAVRLVRSPSRNYYEILSEKLRWGESQ